MPTGENIEQRKWEHEEGTFYTEVLMMMNPSQNWTDADNILVRDDGWRGIPDD